MANDTKNRIREKALEKFSQKGFAGTNIRELTGSLVLVGGEVFNVSVF